ncbi:site-2 protease family protein [Candidatus Woesearchaeota archaeon]|nr:hypothetical protein [uncultured archaeon]MBS3129923.1 site-2 protease family protein [Candidatus Woesearchaeota archaeon]HIH38072.1 PDZ domain-containing protein [Candidatus Woesearchaeota archaeon]HIH48168.1 PDZ domain-containing protein [Candidatus Woesearchaeota archaeon]HIJ04313.1 PDZ domain-containing protein [Candidatus Woesearchaeota archaeon]
MQIETIAAFLFIILLSVFLYNERKKLTIQQVLGPFLYVAMFRTKLGLAKMDAWAKKHPRLLSWLASAGILIGFLGMIIVGFEMIRIFVKMVIVREAVAGVGVVLPFQVKGGFYVPFFFWIISIFFIAVVHEFSHGVIARLHKVPVKSSGFAFLGVLAPVVPLAFVEPDEKVLSKKTTKQQLGVFAAGPFTNIVFGFVFLAILLLVFGPISQAIYEPIGVNIVSVDAGSPAEASGLTPGELITSIDGIRVQTTQNLSSLLKEKKPGEKLLLGTNVSTHTLLLGAHPDDPNTAYMGVKLEDEARVRERVNAPPWALSAFEWLSVLVFYLYLLNLGIGLFNLLPLGPVDGGRMLLVGLGHYFTKEKAERIWGRVSLFYLILLLVIIIGSFFPFH